MKSIARAGVAKKILTRAKEASPKFFMPKVDRTSLDTIFDQKDFL